MTQEQANELLRSFVQCHAQRKTLRDQAAGLNRTYKELLQEVKDLMATMKITELNIEDPHVILRLKDCKKAPSTGREFLGNMFKEFLQRSDPNMPPPHCDARCQQFLEFMTDFKRTHTKVDRELQVLDRKTGLKM